MEQHSNDDEWMERETPLWMGCLVAFAMLVMGSILGYLAIKLANYFTNGALP